VQQDTREESPRVAYRTFSGRVRCELPDAYARTTCQLQASGDNKGFYSDPIQGRHINFLAPLWTWEVCRTVNEFLPELVKNLTKLSDILQWTIETY
jgi:hypothetical protein